MSTQLDPLSLSADLLYAVTTESETAWLQDHLATLEQSQLRRALATREAKLSFWLNCYNAYAQLLLESNPSSLEGSPVRRWKFSTRDQIPVAGVWLSLNDIEHGLLRCSKHPWGFGYVPRPLPSTFEREFRLPACDPRTHFVISRGAEHCPPVTVYSSDDVDEALDIAVEWFLAEHVSYDSSSNVATVPQLFSRYRGDFGGVRGIVDFLRTYNAIPDDAKPSLEYESGPYTPDLEFDIELDDFHP